MVNDAIINQAVKVLNKGGVIVFPTDTVWGIGASIKSAAGLKKLYQIKKRPLSKPTAILVNSLSQAKQLAMINFDAKQLIKKYWPGGLTIIVKSKSKTLGFIQGKKETIGLRMPDNQIVLKILKSLGCGLVASSANFNGEPAPVQRQDIDKQFLSKVDFIISAKNKGKQASTIIDLTKKPYKVIRQGKIILEKLLLTSSLKLA